MMPDMNGYEVLEHMKADTELRDIPVIMISALERDRKRDPLHRARAPRTTCQAVQSDAAARAGGASLEKKRLRDEVRASLARLEARAEAARALQLGMLPSSFPACAGAADGGARLMEPAREVGGDLYDASTRRTACSASWSATFRARARRPAMFMARTRSLARDGGGRASTAACGGGALAGDISPRW